MSGYLSRRKPVLLGIGGTLRPGSSSELALRSALAAATDAETEIIAASDLDFPNYDPERADAVEGARRLIDAVRRADGLLVATPGYHGGMSGLIKNALDYLQALAGDASPYLHGKAVGCIVSAAGWQAGATTLTSLRTTVHALRGWPTPLGVVVNSMTKPFAADGEILDAKIGEQLTCVAEQVVTFARLRLSAPP
ncbi:MAG: NAD(P)H-dependent oxidoreductase [Aliidongia sp.]